jgi:hypothetical protein
MDVLSIATIRRPDTAFSAIVDAIGRVLALSAEAPVDRALKILQQVQTATRYQWHWREA